MKPDPKQNKENAYKSAYSTEPAGVNTLFLSEESNVAKTTTVETLGTDTLYLLFVLLWCQECVKVDLGRDIYVEA